MKKYFIIIASLFFISCKKEKNERVNEKINKVSILNYDSYFLLNKQSKIYNFDENHYSISSSGTQMFEQRVLKIKEKKYSVFLTLKNYYEDKLPYYFLRIDEVGGFTVFDTLLGARVDVAQLIFTEDDYNMYPKKSKYNFSVYKSGSADGCYWAYHVIEFDTIKNKFYYKELYENKPCPEPRENYEMRMDSLSLIKSKNYE